MLIAKDELEKLLNAGKTYEEIAEILDISYSCVRNTVIKHFPDKAKKAKRLSETEKKEILRLYETGMKKNRYC